MICDECALTDLARIIDRLHELLNDMIKAAAANRIDPRGILSLMAGGMCHILQNMGEDLPTAQHKLLHVMDELWPMIEQQRQEAE